MQLPEESSAWISRRRFLCGCIVSAAVPTVGAILVACTRPRTRRPSTGSPTQPSLSAIPPTSAGAPAVAVSIDRSQVAVSNFQGFGVNWGPYHSSTDNSVPQLVKDRIAYMRLPWARTFLDLTAFTDANNNYDWTTFSAVALTNLVAAAEGNGTKIFLTHASIATAKDFGWVTSPTRVDPRFTKAMLDSTEYLVRTAGNTNIQAVTPLREPSHEIPLATGWTQEQAYGYFKLVTREFNEGLESRNLLTHVRLASPDLGPSGDADTWWPNAVDQLHGIVSVYCRHYRSTYENVETGGVESWCNGAHLWAKVRSSDPNYRSKGLFGNAFFCAPNSGSYDTTTVDYGTHMADGAIQYLRGGTTSVQAWMLDDESWPDGLDGAYWGMWSIRATGSTLKPWFYPWSLLSRYVTRGSIVYRPTTTDTWVRPVASRDLSGVWTFAMSNWATTDQSVSITVPSGGSVTYDRYVYSEISRTVDADGFPSPTATAKAGNLVSGLVETVPAKGFLLLVARPTSS